MRAFFITTLQLSSRARAFCPRTLVRIPTAHLLQIQNLTTAGDARMARPKKQVEIPGQPAAVDVAQQPPAPEPTIQTDAAQLII